MAYLLMWTTFWPLFGGLPLRCLSQHVSFTADDAATEAPKLSLFIQNEPLNHTDSTSQSFNHKILNDSRNSRNSIQRRAKLDLKSRPREGRGKENNAHDSNQDNLSSANSNNVNKYTRVKNSDENDVNSQLDAANFVYSTFYQNHPLIQKLTDTKPQKFLSEESHAAVEEELSSFSPAFGEKGMPLQIPGTNSDTEGENGWTPAWYASLYEAGKNFNTDGQSQTKTESKQKADDHSAQGSYYSQRYAEHENSEARFPTPTVPSSSPSNGGGSSFNVGYSIGVSNTNQHQDRGSRTLVKPFPSETKPNQQASESQLTPLFQTNIIHSPSSQSLVGNVKAQRRPEHPPEIITVKPEPNNYQEPYKYEVSGENTVWKHLTPNVEVSHSTTAKPQAYYMQFDQVTKPQRDVTNREPVSSSKNIQTNGHTTPSSAGNGQAFYFYTGKDNEGKPGPASFDHNHALGQSNNFDFSNAMVTLPAALAAQQTAEKGYVSIAQHIHRENKKFEEKLKSMLEGKGTHGKQAANTPIADTVSAPTFRLKSVAPSSRPKKMADPQFAALKNSIQSVIIPMPNGKNIQMPAIIIPLGPMPTFEPNQFPTGTHGPPGIHVASPQGIQVASPPPIHLSSPPTLHLSNPPAIHLSPSAMPYVSGSSGIHAANPPTIHINSSPGIHVGNPSGIHASPYVAHPSATTYTFEDDKIEDHSGTKYFIRGVTPSGGRHQPQRPQVSATATVLKQQARLQQPRLKKPKNYVRPGLPEKEEPQVIHLMPKYNQAQTTPASSYVYYSLHDDPPKPGPENPIIAAGTTLLNAVLYPFGKDSSESADLHTDATVASPAVAYQKLKHESKPHPQEVAQHESETSQTPIPDESSHSHRKRRLKSRKRKKNTTTTPSEAFEAAVATTTVMEPEYAYGYGFVPYDEYASLYSSSYPTKSGLSYLQPHEKPDFLREATKSSFSYLQPDKPEFLRESPSRGHVRHTSHRHDNILEPTEIVYVGEEYRPRFRPERRVTKSVRTYVDNPVFHRPIIRRRIIY